MGIIKNIFDFLRGHDDRDGFDVCGSDSVAMSLKGSSVAELYKKNHEGTIFDELASRRAKSYQQVCEEKQRAQQKAKEAQTLKKIDEVMENPDVQEIVETIVNVKDMLEIMPAIKEYAENSSMEETQRMPEGWEWADDGVRYIIKLNGEPLPLVVEKFLKYISIDQVVWDIDPFTEGVTFWNYCDYEYRGPEDYSEYAVELNNSRWQVSPELLDCIDDAIHGTYNELDRCFDIKGPEISGTELQKDTYKTLWLCLLYKYMELSLQRYGACVLYDPYYKQFYVKQTMADE
jgi:hypothetical protein